MMFKKKCPICGAKNSKERMTCAECGAPLALQKTEEKVTEESLEAIEDIESSFAGGLHYWSLLGLWNLLVPRVWLRI
jgi:uncharacterized OB-fold protein